MHSPSTIAADKQFRVVSALATGLLTLMLCAVLVRVAQLQLAPEKRLREQMTPRVSTRSQDAPRGDIVDRRGRLLASTRIARRVVVDPTVFTLDDRWRDNAAALAAAVQSDTPAMIASLERALTISANRADLAAQLAMAQPLEGSPALMPVSLSTQSGTPAPAAHTPTTNPVRYLALSGILTDEQADAVRTLTKAKESKGRFAGIVLESVPVRDTSSDDEIAALLGKVGFGHIGLMGEELRLNADLLGTDGSLTYLRDRAGKPVWLEEGDDHPAIPGETVRLSIDLELQRIAREELSAQIETMNAAGGRLVMVNPDTGEILAMLDIVRELSDALPVPWVDVGAKGDAAKTFREGVRYQVLLPDPGRLVHPALARNRCVEDIYEPGSTFKPFVWSVITELGVARPEETFNTENGRWTTRYGRYIEDVTKRATMTWQEVLINSSNIGMIKGSERLTPRQLHDCIVRFGFGQRTNLGLPGEAVGRVTPLSKWTKYTHTSVAYGHEVTVTPLQMVRAFSAFARTGSKAGTLPQLRLTSRGDEGPGIVYRVLPPQVALLTRQTMQKVVETVDERWLKDQPEGGFRYDLFGKSGTAVVPITGAPPGKKAPTNAKGFFDNQFISSFIAAGPTENPRLVCLAIIDDPGPRPGEIKAVRYGSAAAGPVARRVMERSLTYLGVPASPRRVENTAQKSGKPAVNDSPVAKPVKSAHGG